MSKKDGAKSRRGGIHIQARRAGRQQAKVYSVDDGANGPGARIGGVEYGEGKADASESLENCG